MSEEKEWFVMLNLQKQGVTPLVNDDDEVMLFETEEEAEERAETNPLGKSFGFEVHNIYGC